ncbi:hypothetical protein LLH00_04230 [bacterium]|nr:hypothetical protein [bacterium]
MHKHKFPMIFILAVLLVSLAGQSAAEMKQSRTSQGNNLGWDLAVGWCMPWRSGNLAFPRGSTNFITNGGWTIGCYGFADLDGDGLPGDTMGVEHIRDQMPNLCSIESHDLIEQWAAAGEIYSQSSKIAYARVWSSLDKDELALWPAEGRVGHTASGAPDITESGETVFMHSGDVFTDWGGPNLGFYMGWTLRFLDFAESSNMCYGHVYMENASEYMKYNSVPEYAGIGSANPDGFTWNGLLMINHMRGISYNGSNVGTWAIHPEKKITVVYPTTPSFGAFTPPVAPLLGFKMVNPPRDKNGEQMDLSVLHTHNQGGSEFGFSGTKQIFVGFTYGQGYRAAMDVPQGWYEGVTNPVTGRSMVGAWPGRIGPEDSRYNQWVWGGNGTWLIYTCYGELHDIAPRDTVVFDFAYMLSPPGLSSYIRPDLDVANMDDPMMQNVLAPMEHYAEVADLVINSGYSLPSAPQAPPLTIIPGDRQVTVTWSDINLQTPDPYYYFLEANGLNPNGYYREYDFEGFRVYRSFVGPSDSHSELLADFNKTANNLQFYYIDRLEDDKPYFRMKNGMKVWYAVQAYDINYDPVNDKAFSLPPDSIVGGKTWNRTGDQLYAVVPRSEASNFKSASMGEVTFSPSGGGAYTAETTASLAGDGSGKLTEPPKLLAPSLKELKFVPVNNEKITADKTISISVTGMNSYDMGCPGNYPAGTRELALTDGAVTTLSQTLKGGGDNVQSATFLGPVDTDGVGYSVETSFQGLTNVSVWNRVYFDIDPGMYTGGDLYLPSARGCGVTVDRGTSPTNVGFVRSGVFEIVWKDAGGGDLTLEVTDLTRGIPVPFTRFCDTYGWGFQVQADFGGEIGGKRTVGGRGNYFDQAFVDRIPQDQRTAKMLDKMPSDNTLEFALWVNGCLWSVSKGAGNGGDGIVMPAPGTVWKATNAFGAWNADKTVFTQYADMPFEGDKWTIQIKKSSMDAEDADLSKIKVAPNPYLASSFLDLSPSNRRIEFINLPSSCTIRIYSLGGVLVNVLNHIGHNRQGWGEYTDWDRLTQSQPNVYHGYDNHGGTEPWNMRNRFGQLVASGLYFYHVTDSRNKTYTGRFYIVN